MDSSAIKKLASSWANLQKAKPTELDSDPNFWAHEKLWKLTRESPEEAWEAILAIKQYDSSDFVLGNIAAGPLEDLLCFNGESVIHLVEDRAKHDMAFRKTLAGVWQNTMSDE